jgi:hypothetical protein
MFTGTVRVRDRLRFGAGFADKVTAIIQTTLAAHQGADRP